MDFQKLKQVHESSSRIEHSKSPRNFDLNLKPEGIESEDELLISQLDHIHSSETSQNPTDQGMNINSNGVCSGFKSQNDTASGTEVKSGRWSGRSLRARRVDVNYSGGCDRVCTNYNCRTTNTPMWRKGPLGPKVKFPFLFL